jgi:hypothetical protein
MVEVTLCVPFTPLIFPTYLLYYALINYVVHNKLELQFASQKKNSHIFLDPSLNLGFDESIKFRVFEFS